MSRSISIVVPVFRSAPVLDEFHSRVSRAASALSDDWELIMVDDASSDGTFAKLMELRARDPRVKVIRFSRNSGQHHATLCGLRHASGEYVFTLDDDLQNPPEEMPKFIEAVDSGYDLVIGRIEGGKRHSVHRNLSSAILQRMVTRILGKPRDIALSSFRCMNRRALRSMVGFGGVHVYLPALMFNSIPADRIANVCVQHHDRRHGRSNYDLRKLVRLASYLLVNHSSFPLRMVAGWGLLVSALSFLYALAVVIAATFYGSRVSGWPSMAVLVSFLSGNIMFCIGILGEYIGRLVEENAKGAQFPVYEEHL